MRMGAVADESGNLLKPARHGGWPFRSIGHAGNPRDATAAGELLLDVTLVLGNGQITAHGIEEPPDNAGTIAITGGTGRYQSAGGEIRFRDDATGTTLLQVTIER